MPARFGFQRRRVDRSLLGKRPRNRREWHYWRQVVAIGGLADSGDLVSLGDQYLLSLGAHATHTNLLLDRAAERPLDLTVALELCSLLTFHADQPVLPILSMSPGLRLPEGAKHFERQFAGGVAGYFDSLNQLAELADAHGVNGARLSRRRVVDVITMLPTAGRGEWAYLDLPTSSLTRRLLAVYQAGLLSISLPARILNFWRVFEAANPRASRMALFESIHLLRGRPLWGVYEITERERTTSRRIDVMARLRRAARSHFDRLVAVHGSPQGAMDHLYWVRRGKTAHADQSAAEYEQAGDLVEQARDAELLRYLARISIERTWA